MKNITELVSFGLAALMFLYAGLSPALEGRPLNLPLLGLAAAAVVLFFVVLRKGNRPR